MDKLKKLRESRRMTQEELAGKMDVSRNTIQHWEHTMGFRDLHDLVHIMDILDADKETRLSLILEMVQDPKCPADQITGLFERGDE